MTVFELKNILKRKFIVKVLTFEEVESEKLKQVKADFTSISRKQFLADMVSENKLGSVEIVAAAPEQFIFNKIYVRADGEMVYINVKKI